MKDRSINKTIVLCADDYGLNSAVSAAILHLIELKRISATSAITTSDRWKIDAEHLTALTNLDRNTCDVGLHLNFTEGKALTKKYADGFPNLNSILLRSQLHYLDRQSIKDEIRAQLDRYCDAMGRYPDFIDGHQHIHQFPIFRNIISELIQQLFVDKKVWLRSTYPDCNQDIAKGKSIIIKWSGAKKFFHSCQKNHFIINKYFAGISNYTLPYPYRNYMRTWLQHCPTGSLIMCHPSMKAKLASDLIAEFRKIEYDYLSSNAYVDDMEQFQAVIKPGSQLFNF